MGALLVLLMALVGFEIVSGGVVRGTVRDVVAAAWVGAQDTYTNTEMGVFFTSKRTLAERNRALEASLDALQPLRYQNEVLRAENAGLRAFLRTPEEEVEGVVVRVVSRPAYTPYDTFIIAAGSADGIAVGDIVEVAAQVAIGAVVEAGEHSALISLFSAPGSEHEVVLNGVVLTYRGRGSGNGVLMVPRDVPVMEGDVVTLSSYGIALGAIGQVSANPEDAYRRALVAPPANLPALQFVLVRSAGL